MKDWTPRIVVLALFLGTLALPLLWAGQRDDAVREDAVRLVIVTPHNEQIRYEFERAFSAWHHKQFGRPVDIDWRTIGGTSDIIRTLTSQYTAKAKARMEDDGIGFDMMFGGGTYDFHYKLKPGVEVPVLDDAGNPVRGDDGKFKLRRVSISQPIDREQIGEPLLQAAFPEPDIAGEMLYDPDGHWWGVVLSSFGIVYNQDVLGYLGLDEPQTWDDLADPRYFGWVALGDPSHSGSVKVTYNAILQRYGFERGVATLRRVFANARYFTSSSSKVPLDVSAGDAAAGMCIDFYGRYQSQMIQQGKLVGFVAPSGATLVSADPIALLRGAPNREIAVRFIRYLLTEQGQALWNFAQGDPWGPEKFELRRAPIRPDIYAKYSDRLVDPVDPFTIAKPVPPGANDYFSTIPVLLHSMCMDIHDDLKAAWLAINETDDQALRAKMVGEFDKLPIVDAASLWAQFNALDEGDQKYVRRKIGPSVDLLESIATNDTGEAAVLPFEHGLLLSYRIRWSNDHRTEIEDRLAWTAFFRAQYRNVADMAE